MPDRKKSEKTGLLVDVRVVLDEMVEIYENGIGWNQVEQMRLMRTKSGRPIGRHEINETFKLSYNDYIDI